MGGIAYLGFIRALAGRVDSEWDAVKARHTLCSLTQARRAAWGQAFALVFQLICSPEPGPGRWAGS